MNRIELNKIYIDKLIKTALEEDLAYGDITTDSIFSTDDRDVACIVTKKSGIVCGMEAAVRVFKMLDSEIECQILTPDGTNVAYGDLLMVMRGRIQTLLKGERTALNIMQHASGIANFTNRCVQLTEGTHAKITDTRKTLPGLRALQKYAVRVGGGRNHRFNLSDCVMIKDNHIDGAGSITVAVESVRANIGHAVKVEVEVRDLKELDEALKAGADIIMLDNMSCDMMKQAVEITNGRTILEASGGVTEESLAAIAATGVDYISIGALTHSVPAFDISMYIGNKVCAGKIAEYEKAHGVKIFD